MLKYMLDTNICIFTIKNKPSVVREAFRQHYDRMCISSVTLMELSYGAEKPAIPEKNLRVVESFIARLEVLTYGIEAATHSGQIRAELAKLGTSIGPYDSMVAAHARSQGLILVTNNTREIERVPGIRLSDWTIQ